ncbi:transglycosylase SLT domain-containing protein [Xenophilus arseniciresistens]|uniref:Transglycosylase SLT domain-containing protein n=1 Tax=Xenophilus arseniciresistens TaxID=1283306 RepID=A0AAE3N7V5_9BURK|nr:transglycosylase SLT domain-containing protein [Xenophilus arseniciresistens]MDA7416188.1 transglycosylase SLT domain-containing protein [Xenophilus arseniciresistens]
MKLLLAALMAGSLLLAGCATGPGAEGGASATSGGSASATAAAPVYPNGTLSPITAGRTGASGRSVVMTAPPVDMWDRIRRGFRMPDLDSDLVRDREQWYSTRPDYIERMVSRSNRYIFHIVEELERRNMPTELALLPYIESAFNPQAVSSARAAGMWQFMPATGTDYDLKQNIFRDDRRDVIASTRAALDYLQRLYGMFGDWHLALASYNWGEGSVVRAIARNKAAGLPTGYTDLRMPDETRYYVPKLQAVKNIVADPARFGVDLPLIANHPYFQTVPLTRDIDVELAAKLADVRVEDFRALNPAAHKPVLLAAGGTEILLPWDNAAVFQRNFEAYTQGQYASWTAWTVPSTMTVADAAQRSGMSESDLRALNNIPPRMMIKAGSTLIVPRSARVQEDVAAVVADTGHLSFVPEVVTRRTVVRAGRNDSVSAIARRYGVSPANVAQWNDVSTSHVFKRGLQVVLYRPVRASSGASVGSGARGSAKRPVVTAKRGGGANLSSARAAATSKRPAAATPVKRGGASSKKKR